MSNYLNEMIGYNVSDTAEWRRGKAEQFPDDIRNLRAAEELESLAAQIDALDESEVEKQITEAHDSLNRINVNDDAWLEIAEAVSEELRSIGFHNSYSTGQALLEWYRDLLNEKLLDRIEKAVPTPNLDEQVANDPTVKAARRAYDEAYAKALEEARKRL
jgi:hypothetical protein